MEWMEVKDLVKALGGLLQGVVISRNVRLRDRCGASIAAAVGGCTALAELSTGEIQVVNGEDIAQFTPHR